MTHFYPSPCLLKRLLIQLVLISGIGLYSIPDSQGFEVQSLPIGNTQAVVVTVDIKRDHLQLFLKDTSGNPYQSFAAINQQLAIPRQRTVQQSSQQKPLQQSSRQQVVSQQLVFAMNAGMFHPDYLPVGLHVEQGHELFPLNTKTGTGNFFMQPNGVFLLNQQGKHSHKHQRVQILSTTDFQKNKPEHIVLATQSGPLLVYQGQINPQFSLNSQSRFIRNAVGIKQQDKAVFVITNQSVSFYELANFFKSTLKIDNALYLDGTISSLYLPALKRHDRLHFLGPIIGVIQPVKRHSLAK
jgi:uncharacterized protein YigE (DUF2233 family)